MLLVPPFVNMTRLSAAYNEAFFWSLIAQGDPFRNLYEVPRFSCAQFLVICPDVSDSDLDSLLALRRISVDLLQSQVYLSGGWYSWQKRYRTFGLSLCVPIYTMHGLCDLLKFVEHLMEKRRVRLNLQTVRLIFINGTYGFRLVLDDLSKIRRMSLLQNTPKRFYFVDIMTTATTLFGVLHVVRRFSLLF